MLNVDALTDKLNRLYEFDIENYVIECKHLKSYGYRIYRDDNTGKHKIIEPIKDNNVYVQYTRV